MNRVVRFIFGISFLLTLVNAPVLAQKPRKILSKADKAYFDNDLNRARPLYEQVLSLQPDNLHANYRLGRIHLEQNHPGQAVPYLLKAVTGSPRYRHDYTFFLARALHLNSNFDQAIPHYRTVLGKTKRKEEAEIGQLKKRIFECESGSLIMNRPVTTKVRNLGAPLNSPENDHVPLLTGNDEGMIFTSRRKPANQTREVTEDIYETHKTGDTWATPKALGEPVNTEYHDAATCISADGKTLYLYRDSGGGDIYQSKRSGSGWGKPEPLPDPINTSAYEPSFFIVNDNQYAFFASDREGGFGGLDIYLTMRQPDGTWSDAMNLGANINTPYDEDAPFISDDGITLFFSSQGHNSMGGFDLFKSSAEGAAWVPAQNLGSPVNTPFDDIYFSATSSGQIGYFSSDRPGGLGGTDIYEVIFRNMVATDSLTEETVATVEVPKENPEPGVIAENSGLPASPVTNTVMISGTITAETSGTPLAANLILTGKGHKQPDLKVSSDSLSGNYGFTVEKGKIYHLLVRKEGYFFTEEEIQVPNAYSGAVLTKNIPLKKIETGTKVVLRNIFFEYNKDVINKSSKEELERLYRLLQENENLRIEISGHTDDRGKPEYNQALSLKRAKAVMNYLVDKGIAKSRLTAVGFGSRRPIASNRWEDGRKQNRRTEFKVIGQ